MINPVQGGRIMFFSPLPILLIFSVNFIFNNITVEFNMYFLSSRKVTQRKCNYCRAVFQITHLSQLSHHIVLKISSANMMWQQGMMSGTKTPRMDEQAEDWTLVHSLEHSKRYGGDWHPLSDTHMQSHIHWKKEEKLGNRKKNYNRVRNFI